LEGILQQVVAASFSFICNATYELQLSRNDFHFDNPLLSQHLSKLLKVVPTSGKLYGLRYNSCTAI
jgi:hypothetical protein